MLRVKVAHIKAVLVFIFLSNTVLSQKGNDSIFFDIDSFNQARYKMVHNNPEQASNYFEKGASYYLKNKDTVYHLYSIVHLSDIKHRQGKFNQAFDLIWDAFPLADNIKNKRPLIEIHQMLGILYQVYDKDSIALYHLKEGLKIAKTYVQTDRTTNSRLTSCYLDVAIQYNAMEDYSLAIKYLDSCYINHPTKEKLHFVDGVYGETYIALGKYKKAQHYLDGVIPFLEKKGHGFQTSISYQMGELKEGFNHPDSAIYYYKKSLHAIDSLEYNIKLKPIVLEALAHLYANINHSQMAYKYMQQAKTISDSLFHAQSALNKDLFEITNKYKEELAHKEEELLAQSKLLLISNKARFRMKLLIGILILLTIIVLIAVKQHNKMKQMAITREKNKAILDIKNKELTANALQIIEKETTVKELLKTIEEANPMQFKVLSRKHKQGNKKIWEDFHLRFTQINSNFYDQLLKLNPDLTPTDLKHCALIKLNFDSKEMSHLLGISTNSVHMARSRIRKKLALMRTENLGNYLATI